MGLELHVPGRLEVAGKIRGGAAHPGDFVEEDDGAPGVADGGGEVVESLGPIAEQRDGPPEEDGVALGKGFQLCGVRDARTRRAAFKRKETRAAAFGEFGDKRAFSDAAAPPARDERRNGFLPQFRQAGQFLFSTMEHRDSFRLPSHRHCGEEREQSKTKIAENRLIAENAHVSSIVYRAENVRFANNPPIHGGGSGKGWRVPQNRVYLHEIV